MITTMSARLAITSSLRLMHGMIGVLTEQRITRAAVLTVEQRKPLSIPWATGRSSAIPSMPVNALAATTQRLWIINGASGQKPRIELTNASVPIVKLKSRESILG